MTLDLDRAMPTSQTISEETEITGGIATIKKTRARKMVEVFENYRHEIRGGGGRRWRGRV